MSRTAALFDAGDVEQLSSVAITTRRRVDRVLAALLVVITAVTLGGVLRLGWVNTDDDRYVYANPIVLQGDYQACFTTPVNHGYNALPLVSFIWEWQLTNGGDSLDARAGLFHLDNLWLHLLCTVLVFALLRRLGLAPWWAALATLWFSIHPMRVESVAWITERKDLLFGLFYLAALLAYLRYLDTRRVAMLIWASFWCLLALLSKVQAVSIPVMFLLLDAYRGRPWSLLLWLEKIPAFLMAAAAGVMGVLAMYALRTGELSFDSALGPLDRLCLGLFQYGKYLVKWLVPFERSTFSPFPRALTAWHYGGAAVSFGLMMTTFLLRKRSPHLAFGLGFFTVSILLVVLSTDAEIAFNADRMSYIPSIGLSFALGMGLQYTARRAATGASLRRVIPMGAAIGVGLVCVAFMVRTAVLVPIWTNPQTLWTNVIAEHPRTFWFSYVNRGQYLRSVGKLDLAMADLDTAALHWPGEDIVYVNRGNVYFDLGRDSDAAHDYSCVIAKAWPIDAGDIGNLALSEAFRNRAAALTRMGKPSEAFEDYARDLQINPEDVLAYNNRGLTYLQQGEYGKAMSDFEASLALRPADPAIIDALGVCKMSLGSFQQALADFDAAIALSPHEGSYYSNRSHAFARLGNTQAAIADADSAVALGYPFEAGYRESIAGR